MKCYIEAAVEEPKPKVRAVASDKNALESELLLITARLSVKYAREVRELANLADDCYKVPTEAGDWG